MATEPQTPDTVPAYKFQFVGGNLCLDYCNTVGGKRGLIAREHLNSYGDFVAWSRQAGLVDRVGAATLAAKADQQPSAAAEVLERAVELREAIYRIFAAVAERKAPAPVDIALLNSELARGLGRLQVARTGRHCDFDWRWAAEPEALEYPLGPVAHSAADLLTSEESRSHVRHCEGDTCGWLFIDASKNHSRRWCDMRDCGNRAKVRRFRLKLRGAKAGVKG